MSDVTASEQLPDQADRTAIVSDLDINLFVEAGAGSGKTGSLVGRIVSLVASGVDIGSVAAITFTEKAAAELRHRLRVALSAAECQSEGTDPERSEKMRAALDVLDHAPIGTLHAFARRILNDYPVQAGLPPGFRVLDELESHLAFEERWNTLLDQILDEPEPAGGMVEGGSALIELCSLDNFGLTSGARRVATGFHDNWDLVETRVDRSDPPSWQLEAAPFATDVLALCETPCPADDAQVERLALLRDLASQLLVSDRLGQQIALLSELEHRCRTVKRTGSKSNWKTTGFDPDALDQLREAQIELSGRALALLNTVRQHRVRVLGALLGRWVLSAARERAAEGTVEFQDLLVLARQLLARYPAVRQDLHGRYRRILLDEFQDTDPIQLEIAVRLASDPHDPHQRDDDQGDWRRLRPLPGRLFIVGDPKQSIYRFRRADIAQYMRAADQIGAATAGLSANFRSSQQVLDWVNHVFTNLIEHDPDVQPAYQALEARRRGFRDRGSVTVLGVDEHADLTSGKRAETLRWREAADAADAVATALHDGWLVSDVDHDQQPLLRPCRPGDITVLLPARTSLPALEAAMQERGLPYRAENSSVVYTTFEIRHLMLALRAVDDGTDELALVAALRTPLYGCSDVELYDWKVGGGSWGLWTPPPPGLADHPVAEALAHLASIARRSTWLTPSDLLAALVDERRLLDAALDSPDARDVWRRVRYVIDQARAWSDAGGHGLRRYLNWVNLMASESRNADTILPEHDHDTVRIMTIHAAKGLEFPITVVSGLTTKPAPMTASSVVWHRDTWTISNKNSDEIYEDFKPLDEQMSDAERRRLLYVACTRAVDHLVVSLHRLPGPTAVTPGSTNAALLHAGGAVGAGARALSGTPGVFAAQRSCVAELAWADHAAWAAERERAIAEASWRPTVSATRLTEELTLTAAVHTTEQIDSGLAKDPVDLDLPPWQRGRYGTAIGRAVHGVLQFADLRTGADIDGLAAAQCAAEGIDGVEALVASLARSALAAPIVTAAVDLEHHRELFVAAPVGDRLLEGYVDLLVRTEHGYVIVDYKTDDWSDRSQRQERIDRYRGQLAAYAVALEHVIGESIVSGVLVRCIDGAPAEQITVGDFGVAQEAVRAALS